MGDRRHANVVNLDEVAPIEQERAGFACAARRLADQTGAADLGATYYEIPPGKTAFPAHYHCATEEAVFVIEGRGTLRIGDERVAVRAGDFLSFPIGPEHAHQLANDGDRPLRYLCISTVQTADVIGYPDSGKIGVIGTPRGAPWSECWVAKWFRGDTDVDYFDGEE